MEPTHDCETDVLAGVGEQSDDQFDALLCERFHNLADIWRRASGHRQDATQIYKQPESRLNVCKERSQIFEARPRLLSRTVAGPGNFQQPPRSIEFG